ncbi:sigma-70 family RNA polymerase sigma factor [Cystobacter fuscus]|uniref:RNA polymerase sigma factor n=1 Tax=Cystobacter fuscus TaxID=43 RepID=UPI002B2D087D|nr:sigma-70 family RNA polymerase sigma factor [Cystobacter fuscus]
MTETDEAELRDLIPRLRRFARALTHDSTAADDLVQASLERAVSRWKSRHEADSLQAWLFSILYRRFLDERKRAGRFSLLLDVFRGPRDVAPSAEEVVIARASLESFGRLPPEQRALMLLVAVEGLSYGEAAEALGVPIGTVMSRLSRARKALRELTDNDVSPPSLRVLK